LAVDIQTIRDGKDGPDLSPGKLAERARQLRREIAMEHEFMTESAAHVRVIEETPAYWRLCSITRL